VRASILIFLCALAWSLSAQAIELTAEERSYIASRGAVTYCVDPDWAPFEVINAAGEHEGIAADLLSLAAARAGITLKLVPTASWKESIQASQEGRCSLLSFLNRTPKRDEWLEFTAPLFSDVNVFITRAEHPYIVDPGSLVGESIVFPRGTAMEELIRNNYPNLRIQVVEEERDAIEAVEARRADMTMRSLIVAAYTIRKEGLFNLKISGQLAAYENKLRVGVAKPDAPLVAILDKGIATISPSERGQIVNKHVAIRVETPLDYVLVAKIAAAVLAVIGMTWYWAYRVHRLNRALTVLSQTDPLTKLANRTKLGCELPKELDRWRRYQRPVSVILLDIDHFKQVNDVHGHLMGDRVLVAIADVLRRLVRASDCVGRWGGEEFLVVCPETDLDQTAALAERIRAAISAASFPTGQPHSVSLGVACSRAEAETADSLLHRADLALYAAKGSGRNRVCRAEPDPADA
jgi:diguanylate cyclase (GGDEF)-like protein